MPNRGGGGGVRGGFGKRPHFFRFFCAPFPNEKSSEKLSNINIQNLKKKYQNFRKV